MLYGHVPGSHVIELRTFGPDGDSPAAKKLRTEANRLRDFVLVKDGVYAAKRFDQFVKGCNRAKLGAFYGVAGRAQVSLTDHKGDAAHCQTLSTVVFADADYKHLGEEETRRRIRDCPLPPSIVVESGGGLHPYWILTRPFYLKREMKVAKRWLRHIAASVADVVDEAVSEPARVLRLPGSYNFKEEYGEPRLVTLSHHTNEVYTLDQIRDGFGEPEEPEPETRDHTFAVPDTIPKGDRHTILYTFLRSQKARHVPLEVALAGCHALNTQHCEPPITQTELDNYLRRVWNQDDSPEFGKKGDKTFPYTEAGDAEFFAFTHRDDVRFDHARKRWLHFNGNRWRPDEQGSILSRLPFTAMRDRQRIAMHTKGDDDARRRNLKWTIAGESKSSARDNLLDHCAEPRNRSSRRWDGLGHEPVADSVRS